MNLSYQHPKANIYDLRIFFLQILSTPNQITCPPPGVTLSLIGVVAPNEEIREKPESAERCTIMASTMQLEFAQAMADFKNMFPEMDRDVIEAVLRANQGAVDATIDQLLAMSTDNQVKQMAQALEGKGKSL